MGDIEFFPFPKRLPGNASWRASNQALGRIVRRYNPHLEEARAIADNILRRLMDLFPLLDELCSVTCPWCPDPCCIVNKVWFDFRDLLFLHLTTSPIPPSQLIQEPQDPCPYLTQNGCRLPRILYPYACTQYLCTPQINYLRKPDRLAKRKFQDGINTIKLLRLDMEDAFIGALH